MKNMQSIQKQVLLPYIDEIELKDLITLFDRLKDSDKNELPANPVPPFLRTDAPEQYFSMQQLSDYFPELREKGIEIRRILPLPEEQE